MDDKNFYPHFTQAEFARRYAVVRAAMQEADLPALLVYGIAIHEQRSAVPFQLRDNEGGIPYFPC